MLYSSDGKIWKSVISGLAFSFLVYFGENVISLGKLATSERIDSKEQLVQILNKEKKKLGLVNLTINAKFENAPLGIGYGRRLGEHNYEIGLDTRLHLGDTEANLRHELYHVYDLENGRWQVPFLREFKALVYQNHNIVL